MNVFPFQQNVEQAKTKVDPFSHLDIMQSDKRADTRPQHILRYSVTRKKTIVSCKQKIAHNCRVFL